MNYNTCGLLGIVLLISGCNMIGYVAQAFRGDAETIDVTAQYTGLEGKTVAVMVAADQYTLAQYPQAPLRVCRAMSARLADNLTTISIMDPKKVIDYQRANPDWILVHFSEVIEAMGVERIVLVELSEYRTHEPGNAHVWQGLIQANVSVYEAEASNPDDPVLRTPVAGQFPEESKVGVLNSDDPTIELGMCTIFSRDAAGLFYDHVVVSSN